MLPCFRHPAPAFLSGKRRSPQTDQRRSESSCPALAWRPTPAMHASGAPVEFRALYRAIREAMYPEPFCIFASRLPADRPAPSAATESDPHESMSSYHSPKLPAPQSSASWQGGEVVRRSPRRGRRRLRSQPHRRGANPETDSLALRRASRILDRSSDGSLVVYSSPDLLNEFIQAIGINRISWPLLPFRFDVRVVQVPPTSSLTLFPIRQGLNALEERLLGLSVVEEQTVTLFDKLTPATNLLRLGQLLLKEARIIDGKPVGPELLSPG